MQTIEHGQRVFVMVGHNGPGSRMAYGKVGVGSVYCADHEAELKKTAAGRAKLKELKAMRKERGDAEVWVNQDCTVICADKEHYEALRKEREGAIQIEHGETYLVVNAKGGRNKWVAWVIGDYATTVHFYKPNDPALARRREGESRRLRANQESLLRHAAMEGHRVVVMEGDRARMMWGGLGNRSGLHSYAGQLISEKWQAKGGRFQTKLERMVPGTKLEIREFRNVNRDRGRWVTVKAITLL